MAQMKMHLSSLRISENILKLSLWLSWFFWGRDVNVLLDYSRDTDLYRRKNNQKARERERESSTDDSAWLCRCVERASSVLRFTWHGPQSKQTRLDYFLVSYFPQKFTVNADIWYAYRSDHYQLKFLLRMKINHVGKEVKHFTTVYFITKVSASYNVLINNI